MGKIVRLGRVFRPRLEVEHRQSTSREDWAFSLEYIGGQGRRYLGMYMDVALAFAAAHAWRSRGVRVVVVGRGRA